MLHGIMHVQRLHLLSIMHTERLWCCRSGATENFSVMMWRLQLVHKSACSIISTSAALPWALQQVVWNGGSNPMLEGRLVRLCVKFYAADSRLQPGRGCRGEQISLMTCLLYARCSWYIHGICIQRWTSSLAAIWKVLKVG